jgi:hypothetical protein
LNASLPIGPAQKQRSLRPPQAPDSGRTWWAHLAFTRINIELTILKNQIEELMNVKGIGEKSFLKIKDRLTVGAPRGEKSSTSAPV